MEKYDNERKFVLEEEQRFRAYAMRNRELGMWVAAKIGKSGSEAAAYATTVVQADLAEAGDEDVFRKVRADLDTAGVAVSDAELRSTMSALLDRAIGSVDIG